MRLQRQSDEEQQVQILSPLMMEGGEDPDAAAEPYKKRNRNDKYKDAVDAYGKTQIEGNETPFNYNRGCVDVMPALVFFAFLFAFGFVTYFGFKNGDLSKLTAPLDAQNNFCGEGAFVDYPKLFVANTSTLSVKRLFKSGVCVKKCPKKDDTPDCKVNDIMKECPKATYSTMSMMDYCIPSGKLDDKTEQLFKVAKDQIKSNAIGGLLIDMYFSQKAVIAGVFTSLILCLAFIYLLSYCAQTLAYISILATWLGLAFITGMAGFYYKASLDKLDAFKASQTDQIPEGALEGFKKEQLNYMILLCITLAIFCCFTSCICCSKDQIHEAVSSVDAAADFWKGRDITDSLKILFVAFFHFFLQIALVFVWIFCLLCVVSMNKVEEAHAIFPQMKKIEWKSDVWWLCVFMFFALLWLLAVIEYLSSFIIITATATFYFNNKRNFADAGSADFGTAWKFAYVNHFGSIVFGALVIAIVRFIKYTVVYFSQKLEDWTEGYSNGCVTMITSCAVCCLQCLEDITNYLNESAFSYIAITGDNFCHGAWQAFLLNLKHMVGFAMSQWIATVFIFLGKIAVVVGNMALIKVLLPFLTNQDEVNSVMGPLLLIGVISYYMASIFLGMFDVSVLAMMTSVGVDINDNGTPIYGPEAFDDFFHTDEDTGKIVPKKKAKKTDDDGYENQNAANPVE